MRPWLVGIAVLMCCPATGSAQSEGGGESGTAVTAIVDGQAPIRAQVLEAARGFDPGVEVTAGDLPQVAPSSPSNSDLLDVLAGARTAYISANFDACLAGLDDEEQLHEHLSRGERGLVARALFWRVACQVGAGDEAGAARDAMRFAVHELELPPDAAAATPDVEAALATAMRQTEVASRATIVVIANARARVTIDGRSTGCRTPCSIDLPLGDHIISAEADGWVPAWRLARIEPTGARVTFELAAAPPELAARQWTERWGGRPDIDAGASMELLALATRARRLILVRIARERGGPRLDGVLTVDGSVAARASHAGESTEQLTRDLMRELLVEGGVVEPAPELVESPWLWIAVTLAAGGAAALTTALLYDPGTRSVVGFF